jgi:hypothetical protein
LPKRKKPEKRKSLSKKSPNKRPIGKLVPQPGGRGAIWQGPPAHPVAGSGRPKDEVRAKLARIANGSGIRFLDGLMSGKVIVRLVGKCRNCGKVHQTLTGDEMSKLITRIGVSVDQRLKGNEQALRYGVGVKDELDIRSHPEVQRFVLLHAKATREIAGDEMYQKIAERVRELAA